MAANTAAEVKLEQRLPDYGTDTFGDEAEGMWAEEKQHILKFIG